MKKNDTPVPSSWLALLSTAVVAVMLLVSVVSASAHASLVRADPADGSVVAVAPRSFTLSFSEPTSPLVLKLIRPDGSSTPLDRFVLSDATLEIEAPADLGTGTYVLSWRVVSEDGHPVGGSAVFAIGAQSLGSAPAAVTTIDRPLRMAIWAVKVGLYAGLFFGVGGAFFLCWIGGRSGMASRLAPGTMLAGLIAAPLSVGLQGLDALGVPLSDLPRGAIWQAGFSTSYGATALIAAVALLAGLTSLGSKGVPGKVLSVLALVAVGGALAASGHASAAHPQWLTRPSVFLHGVGIAFWAGSLVPLGAALAAPGDGAAATLRRFSRTIPFALLPLVVAGMLLALIQLRSLDALWTTAYGQVLLIKLALLVPLFVLAAINRFRLTEPAERGHPMAVRRLLRSILAEAMLVVAILGVAAVWRFTPPPRALAEAAAAPAAIHIHTDKAMADLTVAPGRAGPVTVSIKLMAGDFGPLDPREVTVVLSNPAAGVEQIKRPATRAGDRSWRIDDLIIPLPGNWSVRIDVLISDFDLVRLEGQVDIRR